MVSADISIIPEFTEKMDICGNRHDFSTTRDEIENLISKGKIFFKGILQSRKNNDARLKSVQDVVLWVLDEAQELTDERQFDIIDLSIRTKGAKCEVWLVLNPTDVNHWIYRRFFKEPGVPDDFNGVVGDVCYIHTTYLENLENLDETFIAQANKMKEKNYEKYKNIFLGFWARFSDGLIFRDWVQDAVAEVKTRRGDCWYVYLYQVCYQKGMLIGQIANVIKRDMELCGSSASLIYCDPARPENIAELRRVYGLDAVPAVNKNKPDRVDWLKGCDIVFWGDDIEKERSEYCYLPSPLDPEQYTNIPQDGGDHLMDAANYGTVTHLRRQGIPNSLGQL